MNNMGVRSNIKKMEATLREKYKVDVRLFYHTYTIYCKIKQRVNGDIFSAICNELHISREKSIKVGTGKRTLAETKHIYYLNHREEIIKRNLEYYRKNRDRINEKNKQRQKEKRKKK
jgi:hypothetical protein